MQRHQSVFTAAALSIFLIFAAAESQAQRRSVGSSAGRSPSISRSSGARSTPQRSSATRSTPSRSSVQRSSSNASRSRSSAASPSRSSANRSRASSSRSSFGSRNRSTPSYRGSSTNRSSGARSAPSSSSGSRFSSSGAASSRRAPYGTSSSPTLYRGSYSRSIPGNNSRSTPSAFGRSSTSTNRRSALSPDSRSTLSTNRRSTGSRSATNPGGGGATTRRNSSSGEDSLGRSTGYRSAESYRSGLESRLNGRSTAGSRSAESVGRAGATGAGIGRNSANRAADGGRNLATGSGARGTSPEAGAGRGNRDGRRSYGGARNDHNHGHNHHHHRNNHVDFYFSLGGCGYGLGYYGGRGYYRSSYWDCDWYSWGYRSWYCAPYWYPRYRNCYFPYFWSYSWYPSYRSVYIIDSREPYVSSGYLPAAAFDDDPYFEDAEAISSTTASGTTEAIVPLASGVEAGASYSEAIATGDRLQQAGRSLQAAEAYRQAWIHNPGGDALARMSWALFDAGDFPLAAWALREYLGAERHNVVNAAGLLAELMDGPSIDRGVIALEKYLVANPNDEGSNLLLGSVYVFAGRAYAGYIILGRLEATGFEKATTSLLMTEARRALED